MVAFKQLSPRKILVVGDLALDRYTHGSVGRISPEAPVPVLAAKREEERPGMVGNVALGLKALGQEVTLLSRCGGDKAAALLTDKLKESGIIAALESESSFVTPIKHRLIASNQQILRIDTETFAPLSPKTEAAITKKLPALLEGVDAVAISDYGKGFCTPSLLQALITAAKARQLPILVDPKGRDFTRYWGATLIKPNFNEALLASHCDSQTPLDEIARTLHSQTAVDNLLITRSEKGLSLFPQKGKREDVLSKPLQIRDVTGAGDTVLAILTCALANGLTPSQAARLANMAGNLAVQRFGCVPISLADLAHHLCEASANKLVDEHGLAALTEALKGTPYTLLNLTDEENLTPTLFSTLQEIKELSHKLVVAFDTEPHPLFLDLLASLEQVDYLVVGNHQSLMQKTSAILK